MGPRYIRHTLDLGHPQIGVPLVEPVQRVVVGAEACRPRLPLNRMVEHAAQGTAIHDAGMDTKADDPPGVLVHHHQHPMASEDRRLASEQVHAPQAVFRMPQKRQPGGAARVRAIVRGQDPAHHVLIDVDGKGEGDLLGDPRRPPTAMLERLEGARASSYVGVAARFISTMASTSAWDGPLGPVRRRLGENSQRYLRRRASDGNRESMERASGSARH